MLWLIAAQAHASAYYFLDSGTRAIGRGGAFVVGADDLSAQYFNPAALDHIDRPTLQLTTWAANQYILFDRADESASGLTFDPVENESPPIIEPNAGFATKLGGIHPVLKNTTFAFGFYTPTAPYLTYPKEGAQRYSLTDALVWQVYAGPSLAQRITPWLTVGAGLQYTFLRVDEDLTASMCFGMDESDKSACSDPEGQEDPDNDIQLEVRAWDPVKMSFNAGFIITPVEWLEIGGSVQPPISYRAPGTLKTTFDEDAEITIGSMSLPLDSQVEGNEFVDDDVTLLVTVPLILRAGVQVHPHEKVRVELDGTYTMWSMLSELRITDLDMHVEGKEDGLIPDGMDVKEDIVFVTGYQDSWSVRLGGDVQLNDWALVRAGGHFESSAIPDEYVQVNLVDGPKWGVGGGATFTIAKRVALDVSVAEQFMTNRTITNSKVTQQALFTSLTEPDKAVVVPGKVIGNGDLSSNTTFVGVGATVYLGGKR